MLQERQMKILMTLANLEILTRSQIQVLHDTKSVRNTNFIMQSLKEYTNSIRLKENAYYLNKKGAALVGSKKQLRVNDQLQHKLMRNDAYIYFKPTGWKAEREFKEPVAITPDAYFLSGSSYKFLEVDNVQKWYVNVGKMETYKKFKDSGTFQKQLRYFPPVIWVVKFESRKGKLKQLAKDLDVFCDVYLHDEIKL